MTRSSSNLRLLIAAVLTIGAPLATLAAQAPAPLPPASPRPTPPVIAPTPPVMPLTSIAPNPAALAPAVRAAEAAPVIRPQSATPPAGATMRCKDGTWLFGAPSAARCDRNGGLATILPVRASPPPPPRAP